MKKICGIYCIEVVSGNPEKIGWKYIGQSTHCFHRRRKHFESIKRGNHHSMKLQNYINKYGKNCFQFIFLKQCLPNELDFYEEFFIECYDSLKNGFNCVQGGSNKGWQSIRRPIIMKNIYTNKIEKFESMANFANKYNLSRSNIQSVVDGKTNFVDEWFCPKNNWKPKFYKIISPIGKIHKVFNSGVSKFCRLNGIPLTNLPRFFRMLHRQVPSASGWTLLNKKEKGIPGRYKPFKLIHNNGNIYEGGTQIECIKKLNMSRSGLHRLIHRKKEMYKGWKILKD